MKKVLIKTIIVILIVIITILVLEKVVLNEDIRLPKEIEEWRREDELIKELTCDKIGFGYVVKSTIDDTQVIWKYIDEAELPPKGEKKRIVIIGDSFVWGNGYDNSNHIWWQQLRNIILYNGYENVEVVAAGINGLNTEMEFKEILKNENIMKELDPDIVIIGYVDNDTEIIGEKAYSIYEYSNDFIEKIKEYFPNIYNACINVLINKYSNEDWFIKDFGYLYDFVNIDIVSQKAMQRYETEVLSPLSDYINNSDIPIIFVSTPTLPNSYYEYVGLYDTIVNSFEKYNIKFYNSLHDYIKIYPDYPDKIDESEIGINKVNIHPGVKSCVFFANYVFEILENDYPDILGEKSDVIEVDLEINDAMPYSVLNKNYTSDYNEKENLYIKKYEITYPNTTLLSLPINEEYIKLNLKYEINIKSIKIEINEENINDIQIYTNQINPELGYDDKVMKFREKNSEQNLWILDENESITSINIVVKPKYEEDIK